MKYNPIMEKLDLPAKEELLHWDPKALILSEEKAFRQRVIEVFWRAEAEESQVILLSGPTSSGKTTASRILAEGLTRGGNRAVRISLDDFYKDRSQAPLWEDGQKNFETIDGLDLDTLGECMEDLLATGHTKVPIFDFASGTRSPLSRDLTFDDHTCLIFEGLHALNPRITPLVDKFRILRLYISVHSDYVDGEGRTLITARQLRLLRRLLRDRVRRNTGATETLRLWDYVLRGENLYMQPYRPLADMHINSAHGYEPFLYSREGVEMLRGVPADDPHHQMVTELIAALDGLPSLDWDLVPRTSLIQEFIDRK